MCGILGYTGSRAAAPILLDGLAKLEYRGYDSSGIALISDGQAISIHKAEGKLTALRDALNGHVPDGVVGIGHTRWATHGKPSDDNAHPHVDANADVAVVHNGIVENFLDLRRELEDQGFTFTSQTDSECIPLLISSYIDKGASLEEAVAKTAGQLRGANAVVVVSNRDPSKLVAFRLGNAGGIVVGYGEGEMLLASDLPALLAHTRRIAYLAGGEMVSISPTGASYQLLDGTPIEKNPTTVPYDDVSAAKGEYKHFMLKEIHEQPESVINAIRGRVSFNRETINPEDFVLTDEEISKINRVVLIGMGTSFHAAMIGRLWIESMARIPTEVDNSSEFRYREPVIDERTLVISVSQSGETADTLAGMEIATRFGAKQITLTNYPGTQAARVADGTILLRAGLEIGVASTKTFVCSLTSLLLFGMRMGIAKGTLSQERVSGLVKELAHLPEMLGDIVADERQYIQLASEFAQFADFLFLGRGMCFPMAMEGALKLKEISYIHAEGYPAGEMKHGPISLIDQDMPVVALIPQDQLYGKMLSNVSEAKTRGATIIAVATEGDEVIRDIADRVIYIPRTLPEVVPMLMAVPMQLLAYHIGVRRGYDVDQPRNLAKTVTVE
jgi:glucosamine--fructose-6-phosphate aminotransferase (isomerizing)